MSNQQFYMVYNPKGKAPIMKHATHAAAKAEAQRLAAKQPKDQFYILRSRGGAVIAETPKPDVVALAAAVSRARDVEQRASDAFNAWVKQSQQAYVAWKVASRAVSEASEQLLAAT